MYGRDQTYETTGPTKQRLKRNGQVFVLYVYVFYYQQVMGRKGAVTCVLSVFLCGFMCLYRRLRLDPLV